MFKCLKNLYPDRQLFRQHAYFLKKRLPRFENFPTIHFPAMVLISFSRTCEVGSVKSNTYEHNCNFLRNKLCRSEAGTSRNRNRGRFLSYNSSNGAMLFLLLVPAFVIVVVVVIESFFLFEFEDDAVSDDRSLSPGDPPPLSLLFVVVVVSPPCWDEGAASPPFSPCPC